ncbi:MAG: phenylalanine--tRNA ligase subunit alpha [Bacteroidales bacterium]|nr:phenylalanine--tRNA ligase subunit alpha [Bacteroidales bacterium]
MISKINEIKKQVWREVEAAKSMPSLEAIWRKYLGRKEGILTKILKEIKDLSILERPRIGALANEARQEINQKIDEAKNNLSSSLSDKKESIDQEDVSLPGQKIEIGHLHPLTQMKSKVAEIFSSLGFKIIDGNELETEYYNFEALNIPASHPARDMWDTFFADSPQSSLLKSKKDKSKLLLRTHTSPMQIRVMEKEKPPLRVCVIGRCFRNEATDASHEHTLYQIEGFCVDKEISVANLIYTLRSFLSLLFEKEVKVRLRPNYFPFTEPSFEMDFSCLNCHGKGCPVCGQTGWVEMLGCGMIHPKVYEAVGYIPGQYSGFAFGIGLDRLVMMKNQIDNIRWLHSGDLRFIKQF